jgi:hypothetical protein
MRGASVTASPKLRAVSQRNRLAALAAAALWLAPAAALAQAGHPDPPEARPRPLHLRLAQSDAAALAAVEAVEPGRIRVAPRTALRGELQTRFELKRAPSAPPPLAAGDVALLLLRGARSPYLLEDRPDELWKLAPGQDERALAEAVAALDAAAGQPAAQAALYAAWLASRDVARARVAAQGFEGDAALLAVAPAQTRALLAEAALGADDEELRDAACRAAEHDAAALRLVLAGLPGRAGDAEVVTRALAAGLKREPESARAAALRVLAHSDAEIRAAALRLSGMLAADPQLRAALTKLASDDSDERIRLEARNALAR